MTVITHPNQPTTQSLGEQAVNAQIDSLQKDSVQRNADHTAMDVIAHDTGGEAFYNNNGLENAVARVLDHGARFYTVTYTPTNPASDGHLPEDRGESGGAQFRRQLNLTTGEVISQPMRRR